STHIPHSPKPSAKLPWLLWAAEFTAFNMAAPIYRPLTAADIPGAQRLRELAKWNQTDRDWQNLLRFDHEGCFAVEMDGRLVGTATTTRFTPRSGPGSLAWIGMVLVDPECRRHGIGSTLLKNCIAHLQA